jgi:hypothetical protein
MFFHPKRQNRDTFEDERKTTSSTQLKKMNRRKSQNKKKSKYSKKEKKLFCAHLQDSSKSLENKCVQTRLLG